MFSGTGKPFKNFDTTEIIFIASTAGISNMNASPKPAAFEAMI